MRIQLANIAKRFGKVTALHGIELDLPSGAKIALIGPNGSGKTTLMRVLLGLVQHQGKILIDGRPLDRRALAPRIAYVPQIAPQVAASCGDLVRAITELRGLEVERVRQVLRRGGQRLVVVGAVVPRRAVGLAAALVEQLEDVAVARRPLEHHVLEQVRHPGLAVALHPRPHQVGDVDRDGGLRRVREHQHLEAIGELVLPDALDGADQLRGRGGGGLGCGCGLRGGLGRQLRGWWRGHGGRGPGPTTRSEEHEQGRAAQHGPGVPRGAQRVPVTSSDRTRRASAGGR